MSFAFGERAARERDGELLAAVAGERVAGPELGDPGGRALLQEPVAGLVTALVVVVLEEVEVEHRDAERLVVAAGARQLARELLLPGAAVEEPGQVVRARDLLEASEQVGALERHRGLGGEHAHRRGDPAVAVDLLAPARRRAPRRPPRCGARARNASRRPRSPGRCAARTWSSQRARPRRTSASCVTNTVPAPDASSASETRSGGAPWRPWFAVMTRSPSGLRSISLAKRAPVIVHAAEQITSRATLRVGRPGELARGLGHGGHADDELARLLLADLELLRASQILRGARSRSWLHERLDREADDRSDADPEQRARPLAGRVLGLAQDEQRHDEHRGDACDADCELLDASRTGRARRRAASTGRRSRTCRRRRLPAGGR